MADAVRQLTQQEPYMLMIRRYDPQIPGRAQQSVQEYSRNLTRVGKWLFFGCGALLLVPLTQVTALALGCLILSITYLLGFDYRRYIDELIKHTSILKLIKIFCPHVATDVGDNDFARCWGGASRMEFFC
jgi:hypothetical protein